MSSFAAPALVAFLLGCILGHFFGWMLWAGLGLSIFSCFLWISGNYLKVPGFVLFAVLPIPFLLGTLIGEGHHLGGFFLWLGRLLS